MNVNFQSVPKSETAELVVVLAPKKLFPTSWAKPLTVWWLREMQARGIIPYKKIGHRDFSTLQR